jgi:DNA-binding beta-propeller fold protein YncE
MAFDEKGILWVSCDVSGVVLAVDPGAGRVLEAVAVNSFGTHWISACHSRAKLYATNKTYPFVCVIDTAGRRLAATIPLPEGSEGLALSPDGTRLYVAAQRPQLLVVIDTAEDRIIEQVPLAVFEATPAERNPQKRVRVSPDGRWLVISSFNTGQIAILPADDLRAQRLIAVEKGPMGVTFADARTAYVMNHDQGSISVIDVPAGVVAGRFETAPGPETLALY